VRAEGRRSRRSGLRHRKPRRWREIADQRPGAYGQARGPVQVDLGPPVSLRGWLTVGEKHFFSVFDFKKMINHANSSKILNLIIYADKIMKIFV
jgi:hypothetical protein